MLPKLIKHDLKYIYKQLIIFYSIVLISAIVTRLTDAHSKIFLIKFIHEFAFGCTLGFGFGMFINASTRTWVRLRLNFYGSEAYLTHTLPVGRQTLWAAKFISGIIVVLTNLLVCLAAFLILTVDRNFINYWALDDPTMLAFYASFALAFFCQLCFIIQSGFTGIILGHLHNNNRIVLSIVYGLIVYYVGSMILLAIVALWALFDPEISNMIWNGIAPNLDIANELLLGFCLIYLVLIGILYGANRKLLARGINVD